MKVRETLRHEGKTYAVINVLGSTTIPEGKYLLDPASGLVEMQWVQGIGSEGAPAPQAKLMSVVISGILDRKLPWGLVLLGVFLVITIELLGIRSLSFAVGSLPFDRHHRVPSSCGGVVRWLAERDQDEKSDDEAGPGALYASGLIAAGGIVGLLGIAVKLMEGKALDPEARHRQSARSAAEPCTRVRPWAYSPSHSSRRSRLYHFARKPLKYEARQSKKPRRVAHPPGPVSCLDSPGFRLAASFSGP